MPEFDLIERYFTRPASNAVLGVGDDAALVRVAAGMELAISTDMLVSGTHFLPDTDPFQLGHKTLAVNLSDMAAMGATPRWATLSLSLPEENAAWLERFSAGLFALADAHGVSLIGGDTTRGPLNLCVTILGEVPAGAALRREAARPGDEVWVSGSLGGAALGLAHLQGKLQLPHEMASACVAALQMPQPRVALGLALRGLAHGAIDISDGLLADLGHILERSGVAAEIEYAAVPAAAALRPLLEQPLGQRCLLGGGDDYELCFTAPAARHAELEQLAAKLQLPLTCIGRIREGAGCTVKAADGSTMTIKETGYDHFAS